MRPETVKAVGGHLDLRNWNPDSSLLSLEGEWKFYPYLLPKEINEETRPFFITLPSHWNQFDLPNKQKLNGFGLGTHRLKLLLPIREEASSLALLTGEQDTSHAIFVDGKYLGGAGQVGKNENDYIPGVKSSLVIIPLQPGQKELILDLVVANFAHRKGGAWNDIILSNYQLANQRLVWNKMNQSIVAAILGFVAIIFLLLYFFEDKSMHAVGIFAFAGIIFLRNITTGERIILDYISLPYSIVLRLEYLSWFWTAPILTLYFHMLFPEDFKRRITRVFSLLSGGLTLILLLPSVYFTETASVYPFIFLLNGGYIFYALFYSFVNKRAQSKNLVFGTFLLLLASINDTLHAEGIIHSFYVGPLAVIIFVSLQVNTFGVAIKASIQRNKDLAKNLISLNESYSRFFPKEFMKYLGKTDIRELKLGEQIQKKMTILFADIRSFTEFSESLTPKENFDFLNAYLQRVGPIIRHNRGFIDKFIGDAIMALFPYSPDDAIRAAVQMQSEIRLYNEKRVRSGYQPIKVGVGIHTGNLILGILGEHERLEGTVISDAVNLASRIEGVTKMFGAEIVISADSFIEADQNLGYEYRLLDRVAIKGKSESVYVVEVLNGYEDEKRDALIAKKFEYTVALEAFRRQEFEEAKEGFLDILNTVPQDNVSRIFLKECERHLQFKNIEF
ncbi:adenylate/guanylate cyclase catalytic domain protein [Leptospira ryugenii]|uniref:Adenylate/guanylate cyclase catalytic domain protein n=2 Tax=Leptospira ryugenii TaxID=1917863 RepID=A0A2P2E4C2_9LEPT|nr:adenylate/guanylate cyclase catalytic domain protein [Leptospira ryugenii]